MAKIYVKNTDGTYTPQSSVLVSNLDIVQDKGDSLTSAMSQKAVTDELATKQDKLVAGDNIVIDGNIISSIGGGGGDTDPANVDIYDNLTTEDPNAALSANQGVVLDRKKLDKPAQYLDDSLISPNIARSSEVSEVDGKVSSLSTQANNLEVKNAEQDGKLFELNQMVNILGTGYQFAGIATPTTNPEEPDQKVFYLAYEPGEYSNFGSNIALHIGEIGVLKYTTSWTLEKLYSIPEVLVGLFKDSHIEDISAQVTQLNGRIEGNGKIVEGQYYYHTAPVLLNRGESVLVQGNFQFPPVFKTNEEGTIFIKPQGSKKPTPNSGSLRYTNNYWYCYTATEDVEYVSLNFYDSSNLTPGNQHKFYKGFFGYLTNIADRLNDLDARLIQTKTSLEKINAPLRGGEFTGGRFLKHDGSNGNNPDLKYKTDFHFYEINKDCTIRILNAFMANSFPVACFYDENKNFVSEVISTKQQDIVIAPEDIPKTAFYVRFATYTNTDNSAYKEQLVYFNEVSVQALFSAISSLDKSVNAIQQEITLLKQEVLTVNTSVLGREIFTVGYYINKQGGVSTNADYAGSDFIPYIERNIIHLYKCESGNSYMALIAFYDKDKHFISEIHSVTSTQKGDYNVQTSEIPENTAFFRVSSSKITYNNDTTYIDYKSGIKALASLNTQNIQSLDSRVTVLENTVQHISFNSFRGSSNNLAPAGILTLLDNHIATNFELIAKITGTIEQVSIGMGYSDSASFDYRSYAAKWVQLTQSQIKVYGYYNNGWVLEQTYSHGLTLTNKTTLLIVNELNAQGTISNILKLYNDKGDLFTQNLASWGVGMAFITNDNTTESIKAELSFMPRDITKNIWVFGDSYFSYWPKFVYECGFTHWLRDSQPGLSPVTGVSDFQNLLSLGYRPVFAVYCLGMNGDTTETEVDGHYVISTYQKKYIDSFVELCQENKITPVLTCIPTVPIRQKTGFREYVQSLDVRYIDMFEAVGADEYGIWHGAPTLRAYKDSNENNIYVQIYGDSYILGAGDHTFDINGDKLQYDITSVGTDTIVVNGITYTRNSSADITGLLSSDGVHPTQTGAKVLASRVMLDFPEISVLE